MNRVNIKDLYTTLYEVSRDNKDIDTIIKIVSNKLGITVNQLISVLIKMEIDTSIMYNHYNELE